MRLRRVRKRVEAKVNRWIGFKGSLSVCAIWKYGFGSFIGSMCLNIDPSKPAVLY